MFYLYFSILFYENDGRIENNRGFLYNLINKQIVIIISRKDFSEEKISCTENVL